MDMESKNCRLNQILQMLTHYLVRLAATPTAVHCSGVPPLGVSTAIACGRGTQANDSRSIISPTSRTTPKVQSRVTMKEIEPAQKR